MCIIHGVVFGDLMSCEDINTACLHLSGNSKSQHHFVFLEYLPCLNSLSENYTGESLVNSFLCSVNIKILKCEGFTFVEQPYGYVESGVSKLDKE